MISLTRERFFYRLSWVLLVLLLFITVFGSFLMPHHISPADRKPFEWQMVNGVRKMISPPYPPGSEFWFGSDHRGFDILSLILNGAKYTLGFAFAVTLVRFVIALPIGLYSGAKGRFRSVISTLQLVSSSVPPLLFVYPAMYGLYQAFGLGRGAAPFSKNDILFVEILFGLLVVIGVFSLAHQFAERAAFYSGKEYVISSKTMGASTTRIIFRHLVPHLRPEILFSFLTDFVQMLFLIGQLAVAGLFLGGGEMVVIDPDSHPASVYVLTQIGEWGGLIAYGSKVMRSAPWIVAAPGLFYTSAILILSFFSLQMQKRLTHPHFYKTKTLVQNKPALAFMGAVMVTCAAMLLWVPNKAPQPVVAKALVEMSASEKLQEAAKHVPQGEIDSIKDRATSVMKYLGEGNVQYASAYVFSDSPPPTQAFQKWSEALTKRGYHFDKIGEVKLISADAFMEFQAEVLVKDKNGKAETWYLIMVGNSVEKTKGGPQ
jgi:peptide/nickel transport system permease protein